jgi:hypothetical protein
VYERDHLRCRYCGRDLKEWSATLDHVLPRSKGGRNSYENTVTACGGCNQDKRDRTPEEAGMVLLAPGDAPSAEPPECPRCNGLGHLPVGECFACLGFGKLLTVQQAAECYAHALKKIKDQSRKLSKLKSALAAAQGREEPEYNKTSGQLLIEVRAKRSVIAQQGLYIEKLKDQIEALGGEVRWRDGDPRNEVNA